MHELAWTNISQRILRLREVARQLSFSAIVGFVRHHQAAFNFLSDVNFIVHMLPTGDELQPFFESISFVDFGYSIGTVRGSEIEVPVRFFYFVLFEGEYIDHHLSSFVLKGIWET
jgi:hypothetical protein